MGHRWHASAAMAAGLAGERVGPDPGLRYIAPTAAAAEDAAAGWLLDLLGLPTGSDVGFTTGATMASFTGLMAAASRCSPMPDGMSTPEGCRGACGDNAGGRRATRHH